MTQLAYPEAPVEAWLESGRIRSSRRSYDGTAVDSAALDALEAFCDGFRPSAASRTVLLREAPDDIFTGILGAYGKVTKAPSALVFLGVSSMPGADASVGYTGEGVILEATRLGLDTCWIGGTLRASKVGAAVSLKRGERVFGISPVGYATASLSFAERTLFGHKTVGPKPRKSAEQIAPGSDHWPAWARTGVEAARLAPSAMNRQPWRFSYADGRVTIAFDGVDAHKRVSKKLDCGIAMLHFEIGARHAGVAGRWELKDAGQAVGAFILE